MNRPAAPEPEPGPAPTFDQLFAEVMDSADRFGHREHVHVAWLAVRACGVPGAVELMTGGMGRVRPQSRCVVDRAVGAPPPGGAVKGAEEKCCLV